jgi:hypothetical protein
METQPPDPRPASSTPGPARTRRPPSRRTHGGYADPDPHPRLPPTLDTLLDSLVDRLDRIDDYITTHPSTLHLEAHALATEITSKIARLLRDKARASGADADTVAAMLSKALDLLFDPADAG